MNTNVTIGQQIKQINDAIERMVNNSLRQSDLTLVQIWVLMALYEKEDKTYSLKELEHILSVAQSTCAGIVNRLAIKKLVDYFTDPSDKRIKLVRIMPAGEKCCQDARENMQEMDQIIVHGLTGEEQATLHALLQKIYDNVNPK